MTKYEKLFLYLIDKGRPPIKKNVYFRSLSKLAPLPPIWATWSSFLDVKNNVPFLWEVVPKYFVFEHCNPYFLPYIKTMLCPSSGPEEETKLTQPLT